MYLFKQAKFMNYLCFQKSIFFFFKTIVLHYSIYHIILFYEHLTKMASHIKAVKKAKMTHGMCATLCKYKKQNPTCTQTIATMDFTKA